MSSQTPSRKVSSRGHPLSARIADKYALYQESVQDAEAEVAFITRAYKRARGTIPLTLREDFCGTALVSAQWAKSRKDRQATAIDLDPVPLAWGRDHNLAPLGEVAKRVTLLNQNVLDGTKERFDVICALNFSYFVFKTRKLLLQYLRSVRSCLAPGGMFIGDGYGGSDAQVILKEKRRQKGFTYIWDQHDYDPITSHALNYIHFHFRDGTMLERAFTYDWRLWQPIEIQEILLEAGFKSVEVYWEGDDPKTGQGNGIFRPQKRAETCLGWIAYVVASA